MKHHRSTRSRRRDGFTLTEMLLVITAIGALSAMGAVLIGLLMSAESRGTEEVVLQSTFSRLGRQLRADAHAATSAETVAAGDAADGQLNLQFPNGREVRYVATTGLVKREAIAGDGATSHDEFLLPEGNSRFAVDRTAGLVRIVHERPYATEVETGVQGLQSVPLRRMQIEAALDLDRRHQFPANNETNTTR